MNQKNQPKPIPLSPLIIALLLGIIFLGIGTGFLVKRADGLQDSYSATATVIETSPSLKVAYTYDGVQVKSAKILSLRSYQKGDTLTVRVPKDDYAKGYSDQTSIDIITILMVGGGIAFVLGAIAMVLRAWMIRGIDKIVAGGKYIYADVEKVIYETAITLADGGHPYIIQCSYEDFKGKKHQDYSLQVTQNPQPYLADNSNRVRIFIKGTNLKKYRIDPLLEEKA